MISLQNTNNSLARFSPVYRSPALSELKLSQLSDRGAETCRDLAEYASHMGMSISEMKGVFLAGKVLDLGAGLAIAAIEAEVERRRLGLGDGAVYSFNIRFASRDYGDFFAREVAKRPALRELFERPEVQAVWPLVQSRCIGADWENLAAVCKELGLTFNRIVSNCAFLMYSDFALEWIPYAWQNPEQPQAQIIVGDKSLCQNLT